MPLDMKMGLQVTFFLESGFTSLSIIKLSDGHPLISIGLIIIDPPLATIFNELHICIILFL